MKIRIRNVGKTKLGIGNHKHILPGQEVELEVSEDERKNWEQCHNAEILPSPDTSSSGEHKDSVSKKSVKKADNEQHSEMESAPKRKRASRAKKAKS